MSWGRRRTTRRKWIANCSLLCVGVALASARSTAAQSTRQVVLVLGDSLSAEYGLTRGTGWVALLARKLEREKINATVVNASVSGDTTSGGRTRLPALLEQHRPSHVILELGGNDALRGLPLAMTRDNLVAMARQAKSSGAKVVIAGMQVPPNYGRPYSREFAALFASVAKAEGAALVPFFLAGVAEALPAQDMFQADRIHPSEKAQPLLMANVWPALLPMLR
jgi:acyl-CoA thioesterase-1